ncbi:MAG: hypothetical protein WCR24_07285 [Candidatus Methanomethylophilaceae archaeon]
MGGTIAAAAVIAALLGGCIITCIIVGPNAFLAFVSTHVKMLMSLAQLLGLTLAGLLNRYRLCAVLVFSLAITLIWGA